MRRQRVTWPFLLGLTAITIQSCLRFSAPMGGPLAQNPPPVTNSNAPVAAIPLTQENARHEELATKQPPLRADLQNDLMEIDWRHASCYFDHQIPAFASIPNAIVTCKAQLLKDLTSKSEYHALRDFFDAKYPTPSQALHDLPDAPLDQASARHLPFIFSMMQNSAAQETRVTTIFDRITKWVSSRMSYNDSRQLIFDLKVSSAPESAALFTLLYVDGTVLKQIGTNEIMPGVFRGYYKYKITRRNYKDVSYSLDLVNWSWTGQGITCKLFRLTSDDTPIPCVLVR